MKDGAGKKSSPLDDIRPQIWEFDGELLDLLWVLDATVDIFPRLSSWFEEVLKSNLFVSSEFPQPTEAEKVSLAEFESDLPLFNMEKYEEYEE